MSDIGILNSPLAIAFLLALLGGPGLGSQAQSSARCCGSATVSSVA